MKKLSIADLKVQSFITSASLENAKTVKGGGFTNGDMETGCGRSCDFCGGGGTGGNTGDDRFCGSGSVPYTFEPDCIFAV